MRATDFYSADDYYAALEERWATDDESMAECVVVVGGEVPEQEWLLDPRDVWVRNPYYTGAPGRHPEDDHYDEEAGPAQPGAPSAPLDDLDFPF